MGRIIFVKPNEGKERMPNKDFGKEHCKNHAKGM
jgi:hypothetical protein